jgi:hypothetical protein
MTCIAEYNINFGMMMKKLAKKELKPLRTWQGHIWHGKGFCS